MTNCELIEPYLNRIGLRFIAGDRRSAQPVGVFALHDYVYQIFDKRIRHLPVSHKAKQWIRRWSEANDFQFKAFFSSLDDERTDKVIELMDDFETHLHNPLEMLRMKFMECVDEVPSDIQQVIADLQICSSLAQVAQIQWHGLVKRMPFFSNNMRYNDIVHRYAVYLSGSIFSGNGGTRINKDAEKDLEKYILNFENAFVDWMRKKEQEEQR